VPGRPRAVDHDADDDQRDTRDLSFLGYPAQLDPAALGYPLTVIVRVRPAPLQLRGLALDADTDGAR